MKYFVWLLAALPLLAQNPPTHPAWNGDKVHEIRIRFAQPDYWDQLAKNYLGTEIEAAYLEGSLEWGEYKFASVGVRYKGNSSYRGAQTKKKPFRIKLNEFVKGQKIEGIGAYNLSNSFNDPSMVREPLYYEMSRALGLKTPRTNYARLYVNDEYIGLYVLGEVVNSDFLKNYFGKSEDTGNLYKGNIGASFAYLGEDKARYKEVWEKQTNEDADDWTDLIDLCRIVANTPVAELRSRLEPLMDVDSVLTALALDNATVNLDSYVGLNQNFNIYRRPSDGRWVWVVWDPSLAFGAFQMGGSGTQLATEYVQNQNQRPLATKLWQVPEYRERYRQIYKRIVETTFNATSTIARANQLREMIRPWVQQDTQLLFSQTQFENAMTATGNGTPGMEPFITARTNWLKTQFSTQYYSPVQITPSATSLDFAMTPGGSNPASKTLSFTYTGVTPIPTFSIYAKTTSGTWLVPNVTGGALPGSVTVAIDAKSLSAGVYTGSIVAYLGGASEVTIPVTLTVGTIAAPVLTATVDSASYQNLTISPGQIVTLFGSNFATGSTVTFDGTAGTLIYVTPGQIGVTAPLNLAGKTQTSIVVSSAGQSSAPLVKTVAPTAPGLFTLNAAGTGAAAVINQAGTINTATAPAPKGSIVAFYLTGGGVSNAEGRLTATTTVTIGGLPATLAYAGIAPASTAGLYQVNATVPAGAASGSQPVVITIGGVASQAGVTLEVQ